MKIGDRYRIKPSDRFKPFWHGAVVEVIRPPIEFEGVSVQLRIVAITPNHFDWRPGSTFMASKRFLEEECVSLAPSLFRRDP